VSISENLGAAAVSFAAVQVSDTQPSGGTGVTVYVGTVLRLRCPSLEVLNSRNVEAPGPNCQHCDSPMIAETPVEVGFFLDSEGGRQ